MSIELDFSRSDFPPDWNDESRINFLFSPFRERIVNPEGFDAKLRFWTNLITDLCLRNQNCIISNTALSAAFKRKNRQPVCLDTVLNAMLKQGSIIPIGEFKVEQETWLGWGFDVLVQKPLSWGFSSVNSLLNSRTEEQFIVLPVVQDLSSKIQARYEELAKTKWTDNAPVFLDNLKEESQDICSEANFRLAVIQLQREKKASVFEEYGEKVIKFRKCDEKNVQPLSEVDKGILNLQRAHITILKDIEDLEKSVLSCQEEAKNLVKRGFKSKAMIILKRKKRLEDLLKKKNIAYDNIENLLCQLKNTGTEKMVLDAYRTGVQAMKRTTTGELDLDNIDSVMADVQGVLDDYNEVQSTLSKPVAADESLEEFEDELESLIAGDKNSFEGETRKESPRKNSDEELLKRLEALRAPPTDISPVKKPALQKPLRAP